MKIDILGATYTINHLHEEDDPALKDCAGYCSEHDKSIVVKLLSKKELEDPYTCKDWEAFQKKVLRHELIHGLLILEEIAAGVFKDGSTVSGYKLSSTQKIA